MESMSCIVDFRIIWFLSCLGSYSRKFSDFISNLPYKNQGFDEKRNYLFVWVLFNGFNHFGWNTSSYGVCRDVPCHHCTSCYHGVLSDGDSWHDGDSGSNPHILAEVHRTANQRVVVVEVVIGSNHGALRAYLSSILYDDSTC